jgi:hypothetical protein
MERHDIRGEFEFAVKRTAGTWFVVQGTQQQGIYRDVATQIAAKGPSIPCQLFRLSSMAILA